MDAVSMFDSPEPAPRKIFLTLKKTLLCIYVAFVTRGFNNGICNEWILPYSINQGCRVFSQDTMPPSPNQIPVSRSPFSGLSLP